MASLKPSTLSEQLELADQLLAGRAHMFEPQDLPGRYGRAVKAIDHLLHVLHCPSVLGGGWAVWWHGFVGRVPLDLDIVLPCERLDQFPNSFSLTGGDVLPVSPGSRPKVFHLETDLVIDIFPEGFRLGTDSKSAPTLVPHPNRLGAHGPLLRFMTLTSLVELKLAARRARDESDVVELMRANPEQVDAVRQHLSGVHSSYVRVFDVLVQRARDQADA